MMRFIVSVLATVAIFLAATAAQAVLNVSVVGTNLTTLSGDLSLAVDGDQVQVDIFIENVGSAVAGTTLTAFGTTFGVGSDTLNWDGGESAGFYFNTVNAKSGAINQGLGNVVGSDNGNGAYYTSLALPRTLSNADIQAGVIRQRSVSDDSCDGRCFRRPGDQGRNQRSLRVAQRGPDR
jgi:hypothetical protein